MANEGAVTFSVWLDADEAEKELTSIKKKILDLQAELASRQGKKSDLETQLAAVTQQAEEAQKKLAELGSAKLRGENVDVSAQARTVSELLNRRGELEAALEKENAAIEKINSELDKQTIKYGIVQQQAVSAAAEGTASADQTAEAVANVTEATREAGAAGENTAMKGSAAADALASRLDKLTSRIGSLAKRVLFFSLFTRAFRAFRDYVGKALQTSDEFTAAVARLKGALATAFQPIFTAVLPALTTLINLLAQAAAMLASFVSMIFGSTAEASADAAENLYDEAEALNAVGGGAGKAKRQLASFDEVNQLSSSGGGGGGSSKSAGSKKPDFLGAIRDEMDEIEIYLSGALLVLGAILTFTGANVPLGLGLMAVGALGLAKALKTNWKTMPDNVKKALTRTLAIIGAGAIVIGTILALSGANLPLGIGLMVAGAAALGTAAALNWDKLNQKTRTAITKILQIAGASLLAVGLILAASGAALPLGIGLIAAGAVSLAAAAALNWSTLSEKTKTIITGILQYAGASLLAIGLVLAISGAALPLGIGLMVAGAAALGTAAVLNWDKLKTDLGGALNAILLIGSAALLVLGLILALSGAALPLGIALIAAGAAGLVTVAAINWDAVKQKLSGAWTEIKNWWNTDVSKFFTLDYWTGVWDTVRQGLVAVWQQLTQWLRQAWDDLRNWWNGLKLKSPMLETGTTINDNGFSHSSGKFESGDSENKIPRLAAGAVIPPNREFLAVLGDQRSGTNVEAPLDTIVEAVRAALGGDGYGTVTIPIYLDGEKIAENTVQRINRNARGSGRLGLV